MSVYDRGIKTDPLKYSDGGFTEQGKCFNTTASTTSIVIPELAGFGDDFFNDHYYMQVLKNADSAGAAPEGEYRLITDYVSATGTFITDAFSATVAAGDELLIMHELIYLIYISTSATIPNYVISDMDNFDVADADADNARWNTEYITGTEGGSADINTSTANKLMLKVDPDASPTEARYAVSHNIPFYADFFNVTTDLSVTWGATDSATAKAAGILVSKGAAYDSQNYLAIERQKGTAINRVTVSGALNNVAITPTNATLTDDTIALKIERYDTVWRFYYSTAQYPAYNWVLVAQVEDPSDYMSGSVTYYQEAYSKGTADTESVQGDFGYFRYIVGSGGGSQYLVGDYDSAWVTADKDGNLFERIEYEHDVTEYLYAVADGGTTSPTKVLDNSILSILMTKDSGGDISDFNNSTDSLEAQSDKLGAFSGDGGAAQDDSVKASLDLAHTDIDNIYIDTQAIAIVVSDIQTNLLPDLSADVSDLQTDLGDPSTRTNLKSIEAMLGNPDMAGETIYAALTTGAGQPQVFTKAITSAANAGDVIIATVTTQPVLVKSLTVHSDGATTADLTSIAISGGAGKVIEFITAVEGAKANIDAQDKQVSWPDLGSGGIYLPTGATIVATLAGTGATAVDLNVVIEYVSTVSGGYLA